MAESNSASFPHSTPNGSSRHEKSLGLLTVKFVTLLQEAKDGVLDLKVVGLKHIYEPNKLVSDENEWMNVGRLLSSVRTYTKKLFHLSELSPSAKTFTYRDMQKH